VDVDPNTLNLNPGLLEGVITPRTRAIIPNHVAGLPADMDRILAVANQYRLRVIGDAAYAYPARTSDRMIGEIGDLTCFSFSSEQPMTTGAGGIVCTADANLAHRCRTIAAGDAASEDPSEMANGTQWRMTDIAAALGIAQLRKADQMWHRRLEIAISYNATFSGSAELQCPEDGFLSQHAWCLYMLRLNLHRLRIDRDEFLHALAQRQIAASIHFTPLHLLPEFRERFAPESFPVALQEHEREISLPIYPGMTDRDVQDVIDAVTDTVEAHRC
jgi:dTDP-4-amino-4,6-dideoxygalactose transaminase